MHVIARFAIASLALVAVGCGDVCDGVAGTCVALTVDGSGQVDGIEVTLSGAANGRRVGPAMATVQDLPVTLALQLSSVSGGALHIDATGVLLGRIVGEGNTNVTLSGSHASATVRLGAAPPIDLAGSVDFSSPDLEPPCVTICSSGGGPDLGGQSSCWTAPVDCNTVQQCGSTLQACSPPSDMGAYGAHCDTNGTLYCCPSSYPVFCNTTSNNCGHCWTSGTNCGNVMTACPDGTCHSCNNSAQRYNCSTNLCQ
jgi:hypothetical protein